MLLFFLTLSQKILPGFCMIIMSVKHCIYTFAEQFWWPWHTFWRSWESPKIKQNAVFVSCCIYFIFLLVASSHDCPVPTCKAPKRRKHKRKLRLLPAKWRELAPEVKEPIIKELGEQREKESVCLSVIVCVFVCLNCLYMCGWAHTHTWNRPICQLFFCVGYRVPVCQVPLSTVPYSHVLCA